MLDPTLLRKLESLTQLPAIPSITAEILNVIDNPNISAKALASMIERDQALTMKVLKVANSPFYGFTRKISTVDLAIVIMGLNTIKEIIMSIVIQKFFTKIRPELFDVKSFWEYSVFCGACARIIARKLGYRLAGEAFVAGLMHDIGVLIIVQYFNKQFHEIRKLQVDDGISLIEAEKLILKSTHADIGGWIAKRWNLPSKLCEAISYHHSSFQDVSSSEDNEENSSLENGALSEIKQPLTLIVALTEYFSQETGLKRWSQEQTASNLYLAYDIIDDIGDNDLMTTENAIEVMKQEIIDEYHKASIFNDMLPR